MLMLSGSVQSSHEEYIIPHTINIAVNKLFFYYSFHIYYHLKILITLFSSKFSKYLVYFKYRLFKGVSDISYFFEKRENGLSVYYISIVLLTKEGKSTLFFLSLIKCITIKLNVWKANIRFESRSYFELY